MNSEASTRPPARPRAPWRWIAVCATIYALSLALPALLIEGEQPWQGALVLGFGWMGIFVGQIGWAANPVWLASMICLLLRLRIATVLLALLALALGCSSFALPGVELPMDEAGVRHSTVIGFGAGFYVWLAALLAPGVGAIRITPRG